MSSVHTLLLTALVAFSAGSALTYNVVHGHYARAANDEAQSAAAVAASLREAEEKRLRLEDHTEYTLGVILDEMRDDPDAGSVSLGLRDAQRLNQIR